MRSLAGKGCGAAGNFGGLGGGSAGSRRGDFYRSTGSGGPDADRFQSVVGGGSGNDGTYVAS